MQEILSIARLINLLLVVK